ncbi:hypothetical protein EV360DRAFT_20179, partial [Lentinula raphanica]
PRPQQGGRRITKGWLRTLDDRECLWYFRFTAVEIIRLRRILHIPSVIQTQNRYVFSGIEGLCLLLARMRDSGDQYRLHTIYDRSQSSISELFNELTELIDETWAHLLAFDTDGILAADNLETYAEAIHEYGAPLNSKIGKI